MIKNIYYKFIHGLGNLIKWFKIIWNDRDYDYYYILETLKFKLIKLQNRWQKHNYFVGQKKSLKHIKICIFLINRIQEDDYFSFKEFNRLRDINWKLAQNYSNYVAKQDMEQHFQG